MKRTFASLDRHTVEICDYDEPDRYRELFATSADEPVIPRGSGLSYVAASFGTGSRSIGMIKFDRILAFNADDRWIEVEAGITLGRVHEFCARHKLCLPVQPGYPQISIGGCIAGNVHGKNQFREGLFGDHVRGIRLFHPNHGLLDLSRETQPELFDLTIGGFGLTGIIVSARLSLTPLPSPSVMVEHVAVDGLDEAIDKIVSFSGEREMIYAWFDLAQRSYQGRGFIVTATPIPAEQTVSETSTSPTGRLDPSGKKFRIPVLNTWTLPMVNKWYRFSNLRSAKKVEPFFTFLFPAVGKEFYFDWFGAPGFIEMQVLVPTDMMYDYIKRAVDLIRKHDQPIALATIKAFRGQPHFLHYNGSGFSFTIDVCNNSDAVRLLAEFDALNCEAKAITALMKDSRLSASIAKRQYGEYQLFRDHLHTFDPARGFKSALSLRLDL